MCPLKLIFPPPLLARLWCRCWLREVPCLDDPSTSSRNDKASVRWAIQSLPRYMGGPHTFAVARGMRIVSTQRTIEGGARSVRLAAGVRRSIKYTDLSMIDCSVDRRISFLLGVQRAGGRAGGALPRGPNHSPDLIHVTNQSTRSSLEHRTARLRPAGAAREHFASGR